MFRCLETFNDIRQAAVEAEARLALERLPAIFQARIRDMVDFTERIDGGIFPESAEEKSPDLVEIVQAKLASLGYELGGDLMSIEPAVSSVCIARQDVPLPPYSHFEREAKLYAWKWVEDQLYLQLQTDSLLGSLDDFLIPFPGLTESSECGFEPSYLEWTLVRRLELLQPVANWITRTSPLYVTIGAFGLTVTHKSDPLSIEQALLRSNAILFSAVVLPRASFPALDGPDWSGLPRTALGLVQRFLVGVPRVQVIQVWRHLFLTLFIV
jgi:hypothetical protein